MKPPSMSYEEAVTELEQLLVQLQEVPPDIDQLHVRIARAESLVAACRAKLRGVEEKLDELQAASDN